MNPTWASPVLATEIKTAVREVSATLTRKGIPHALIGGIVLGAYRYPRATEDIDFLVSSDAESQVAGNLLGGEVRGITLIVQGRTVDLMFPQEDENFLEAAIERAAVVDGVPVIPVEALVYLKLRAARTKDSADVVEMAKRGGLKAFEVRKYLEKVWPDAAEEFDSLVLQASVEAP